MAWEWSPKVARQGDMATIGNRTLRKHLGTMGIFCLLAPFAYVVGDSFVEGKRCQDNDSELSAQVAVLQAQLAETSTQGAPEPVVIERVVEIHVPTPTEPEIITPSELGAFAFVWENSIVLDSDADPRWGYGPVTGKVEVGMDSVLATRKVDWHADPHLAKLSTETFVLYGPKGEVCRATLTSPHLRAEISGDLWPLMGDSDRESGLLEEMLDGPAGDDARQGKKTLRRRYLETILLERTMDEESNWLVADLKPISGDCEPAMWARAASRSEPTIFTQAHDDDFSDELIERFRGTKAHAQARASFNEEVEALEEGELAESWTGHEADTLDLQRWTAATWARLDIVEVGEVGSCGDPETFGTASWLNDELLRGDDRGMVDAVFTLDGQVHALRADWYGGSNMSLLRLSSTDGFQLVTNASVNFYGCSC